MDHDMEKVAAKYTENSFVHCGDAWITVKRSYPYATTKLSSYWNWGTRWGYRLNMVYMLLKRLHTAGI